MILFLSSNIFGSSHIHRCALKLEYVHTLSAAIFIPLRWHLCHSMPANIHIGKYSMYTLKRYSMCKWVNPLYIYMNILCNILEYSVDYAVSVPIGMRKHALLTSLWKGEVLGYFGEKYNKCEDSPFQSLRTIQNLHIGVGILSTY